MANKTLICTNARDETSMNEWVSHHLLLGFDYVLVFDHLSMVPLHYLEKQFPGKVSVIRVGGTGNIKLNLMKRAVEFATNARYNWMLYLDADEYLCLNRHNHVNDFLASFQNADAIGVNWLMFGTSGHVNQPPGLIINEFTKSDLRLNPHVKSFVRPSSCINVTNPHYFVISNPSNYYSGNGTRMPMNPFNNQPLPFMNAISYIAHYYTQSEKEHYRRKSRQMDDGTQQKHQTIENVHQVHNEVTNTQLKCKYGENVKRLLQARCKM